VRFQRDGAGGGCWRLLRATMSTAEKKDDDDGASFVPRFRACRGRAVLASALHAFGEQHLLRLPAGG